MELTAGLSGRKKWKRQEVGGVEEFWKAKFQKAPEGCPASLWSPHPFATAPVQLAGLSFFRGTPKRRKNGVNCFGERVLFLEFYMWQPESSPMLSGLKVLHFTMDFSDNMVLTQRRRTNGGKSLKMMSKGERLLPLKRCHVRKKDQIIQRGQTRRKG